VHVLQGGKGWVIVYKGAFSYTFTEAFVSLWKIEKEPNP
jgi:hypothetical protein